MRKNIIWISLFSFAMTTIAESSIASANTVLNTIIAEAFKEAAKYLYEHEDKGLLIDYQSLPADRVYSLDELKENLQEKVYKRDSHAEDRKRWLKKCFDNRTMDDTIQALLR